jgi:predicted negative regulator of RcsB-dependent stress response
MVVIHKKKIETAEEKEARLHQEKERAMGLQDEYQAKGFELVTWVQDHKGLVSALIVLLFVAGGAVSAFLYYQQRSAEQASSAYLTALKAVEGVPKTGPENIAKWKAAQEQLATIAKENAGTGVGNLAALYAAHLALENNEGAASVEFYQNALKKMKKNNDLYPLALIGLGYAQDRNGQPEDALASFNTLIEEKSSFGRDLALWEAARLAVKIPDKKEKAAAYVNQLLEEYPASSYENNAKRLKESL